MHLHISLSASLISMVSIASLGYAWGAPSFNQTEISNSAQLYTAKELLVCGTRVNSDSFSCSSGSFSPLWFKFGIFNSFRDRHQWSYLAHWSGQADFSITQPNAMDPWSDWITCYDLEDPCLQGDHQDHTSRSDWITGPMHSAALIRSSGSACGMQPMYIWTFDASFCMPHVIFLKICLLVLQPFYQGLASLTTWQVLMPLC